MSAYCLDSSAFASIGLSDADDFETRMVFVFLTETADDLFSDVKSAYVLSLDPSLTSTNWTV